MKDKIHINLMLSLSDHEKLCAKAKAEGIALSAYIRMAALAAAGATCNGRAGVPPPAEANGALKMPSRIGAESVLNQHRIGAENTLNKEEGREREEFSPCTPFKKRAEREGERSSSSSSRARGAQFEPVAKLKRMPTYEEFEYELISRGCNDVKWLKAFYDDWNNNYLWINPVTGKKLSHWLAYSLRSYAKNHHVDGKAVEVVEYVNSFEREATRGRDGVPSPSAGRSRFPDRSKPANFLAANDELRGDYDNALS